MKIYTRLEFQKADDDAIKMVPISPVRNIQLNYQDTGILFQKYVHSFENIYSMFRNFANTKQF